MVDLETDRTVGDGRQVSLTQAKKTENTTQNIRVRPCTAAGCKKESLLFEDSKRKNENPFSTTEHKYYLDLYYKEKFGLSDIDLIKNNIDGIETMMPTC